MLGGWMLRLFKVQHAFQRRPVNIVSTLANGLCSSLRNSSALAFARRPSLAENARFEMSDASYGNFDLVKRVPVDKTNIIVSKWRSRVTGLSVVHIDYEAPIVKGYFAVATEIFNDSGCPHTLEHLVFMGSEQYPYKGVLDNLASRAFSEGTNAWTQNDNTVYTVSTAGQQGFLQLLPIYVDHILYPTIQKAGYITEVHHIDGEGNDSGVVYSEMQGVENTSSELMQLKAQQTAYPPGSAYRSETGGLMGALRVLDVDTIRAYHKSYYVPHNLCLIVAGSLSTQALLETLQKQVEPQIIKHGQAHGPRPDGWKRPFMETASSVKPEMKGVRKELAEFPEKDESSGELAIYLLGPPPNDDLTFKAIDTMSLYLTESAAAPLNKEFVEIPEPYCTYVAFSQTVRSTFSELNIYFGSVPTEHLETLDDKFRTCLARIVKEGIDMDRMSTIIKRDQLKYKSYIENSGGDVYTQAVIGDFMYGDPNGGDMPNSLREFFEELKHWTAEDWANLLSKYLIDAPYIAVRGKPSAALAEKLEKDEKARLDAQIAKLGPEGLARLQKELDSAKAENDAPIPEKILTDFPVPEVRSISWIAVQSAKNVLGTVEVEKAQEGALVNSTELAKHIKADGTKLPLTVYYDHVASEFVSVHALMNLASVANEDRPYVVLYLNALFTLPLSFPDGTRLTHEEVINLLDKETVSYDAVFGVSGSACELLGVSIKVEVSKYATGISLLRDLIYHSEFAEDRLGVTIAKLQQSLPQYKRDGNGVAAAVSSDLTYDASCTGRCATVTGMMEWVPRISKELKENPKEIVRKMKKVQTIMTDPSSFRFSVTGNVLDISKPKADWEIFRRRSASGSTRPVEPAPIRLAEETLSELGKKPSKKAVVLSLPTIESSFAIHTARCFSGYTHPDYPALRVAMEVLNGTESFLWRYIRGSGLAYGASTGINLESGHISFTLYRSPNSYLAFQQGAKVIKGLTDGSIELKQTDLDAAKSSLVYTYTRRVSSPYRAAMASFVNQAVKGVDQTWEQQMLERFNAVTIDEVAAALQKYLLPVFDPATSIAVVASAPGKVDEIAKGLAEVGFQVEKRELDVDPEELATAGEESESESEGEEEK